MTDTRTRRDWAHFVRDLVDGRYREAEAVVPVMVQLNTHSKASLLVPVHCCLTVPFKHATFRTALLFVMTMAGAYGVPVAPPWILQAISQADLHGLDA